MKLISVVYLAMTIPIYSMEKKHYTITNKDENTVLVTTAHSKQITLKKIDINLTKQKQKSLKEQTFEEFVVDQLCQIFFCFKKKQHV